jgi:hypothetical protein
VYPSNTSKGFSRVAISTVFRAISMVFNKSGRS